VYESFYQLTAKPFRLSPDPRLYFESAGHRRAWSYLLYGLNQQEGFVVLTGQPGTGKTLLVQKLLYEINDTKLNIVQLTSTQLNADDLVRAIAAKLRLGHENVSKSILLHNIESHLIAQYHRQIRCLIIVDEAQNLPEESLEELRMLSNFQLNDKALLQVFLLGQDQLKILLNSPAMEQLQQRVVANYQLSAFKFEETKQYIESRLSCVGWQDDPQFTIDVYQLIYEITSGIPRRINHFCDRIMLFSYLEEKHDITSAIVEAVQDELLEENSGNSIATDSLSDSSENEQKNSNDVVPVDSVLPQDKKTTSLVTKTTHRKNTQHSSQAGQKAKLTVISSDHDVRESDALPDTLNNDTITNTLNDQQVQDQKQDDPPKENMQDICRPTNDYSKFKKEVPEEFIPVIQLNKQFERQSRNLVKIIMGCYREPHRYKKLNEPLGNMPENLSIIFNWMLVDDESLSQMLPKNLIVSPIEIKKATLYFMQHVLFQKDANHYKILGLTFDAKSEIIQKNYQLLMRLFDSNKFIASLRYLDVDLLQKIQIAYKVLSNDKTRVDYDNKLKREKQLWISQLHSKVKLHFSTFVTHYFGWLRKNQKLVCDVRTDVEKNYNLGAKKEPKISTMKWVQDDGYELDPKVDIKKFIKLDKTGI